MSTHVKSAPRHESVLGAWHAEVAATAKQSPWLVREMLRCKQELLPKFTAYYQQLCALPRRTRRLLQRKFAPSLAGAALLLALGQGQAIAATINVDASCTLIDAITAANTDTATGGCTVGSGADTIILPPNSTHTLNAINNSTFSTTGLPVIVSTITIQGNSSTIQRDNAVGTPAFRLLAVSPLGNLTLQETTVSGGFTDNNSPLSDDGWGGGILSKGQLTLEGSTVSGNRAARGGGVSIRAIEGIHTTTTLSNSPYAIRAKKV